MGTEGASRSRRCCNPSLECPETFGWHFVDIPWNAAGFSEARDCDAPEGQRHGVANHHNCVVDRITIFEQILSDRYANKSGRVEALKFLVHYIADIHQPMHAIARPAAVTIFRFPNLEILRVEAGRAICIPCGTSALLSINVGRSRNTSSILNN